MHRLGHRVYPLAASPRVLASNGAVVPATRSPVHLVFMHGLMGAHDKYASVCTAMSGAQKEESLRAEATRESLMAVTHPADCGEASGCRTGLLPAAAPRVYPCAAFDWRNHGSSIHTADMTLDGMTEDVVDFLADYAATTAKATTTTTATSTAPTIVTSGSGSPTTTITPLPIILVAHSMGAVALLHWMWQTHARLWCDRIVRRGDGLLKPASAVSENDTPFSNSSYRVVGAVLIDTAPTERPPVFEQWKRLIHSLAEIPLSSLKTRREVEGWMLQHGPREICTKANIWFLRFYLSNLVFEDARAPRWRIGLHNIIQGLDKIVWHDGGEGVQAALRQVELLAISQGLPAPLLPRLNAFPMYFLFGAASPYDTPVSRAAVRRFCEAPCVLEMADADHFLCISEKRSFVNTLQNMCYAIEEASGHL